MTILRILLVSAKSLRIALDRELRFSFSELARRLIALTAVESTVLAPLDEVAGKTRALPEEFIDASGGDVTAAFLDYARPLVGVIAPVERLADAPVPRRS